MLGQERPEPGVGGARVHRKWITVGTGIFGVLAAIVGIALPISRGGP